ncbi:unnamed protein product, partial [Medioppia subpectinata]
HLGIHSADRPLFRCDVIDCGKAYKTTVGLLVHSRTHESGPTLKCGINGCNDMFTTQHQKRKHQTDVHNRAPVITRVYKYRCDWPGCEWSGKDIKEHKRLHSGEKPFQCLWPDCGKRFRMKPNLRDHMNIHNNVKPYACHWPGCTYGATNSEDNQHFRTLSQRLDQLNEQKSTRDNDSNAITESDSRFKSPSKRQLKRKRKPRKQEVIQTFNDINTHTDIGSAQNLGQEIDESNDNIMTTEAVEEESVVKTDSNQSLYESLRHKREEREKCYDLNKSAFICPINKCHKSYETDDRFQYHLRYKHSSPRFVCQHTGCGKRFRRRDALDVHSLNHEDIKRVECPINGCHYRCTAEKYLTQHLLSHSADREVFRCDFIGCQMTYKTISGLNGHQRTHRTVPTYRCGVDECSEMFFGTHARRRHQEVVHNRRPFVKRVIKYGCDWPGCEWTGGHVNEHRRIHTGEMPAVCHWPDCGKRFRSNACLRNHMNIHTNVRPYVCHWPGCQYSAANSGNLAKHKKLVHKL